MKALTRSSLVALALLAAVATTARAQSTIADCEKIQAADAYNQCLAKFGPPAKEKNLEPERPGDIKSNGAEAAASAPARGGHHAGRGRRHFGGGFRRHARGHGHGHAVHGGGGRKRMTIDVK